MRTYDGHYHDDGLHSGWKGHEGQMFVHCHDGNGRTIFRADIMTDTGICARCGTAGMVSYDHLCTHCEADRRPDPVPAEPEMRLGERMYLGYCVHCWQSRREHNAATMLRQGTSVCDEHAR